MKLKLIAALAATSISAFAVDKIVLEDYDYSIFGNSSVTGASSYIAAYWGTFSDGVFTPVVGTNNGYFGLGGDDALVGYSATSNVNLPVLPTPTALALGFFDMVNGSDFSNVTSQTAQAVLTDPSWVAVALSTSPGTQSYMFTAATTAEIGQYSFNGGNEIITLVTAAIPEPSSFAAIAGLAVLGAVASRRRRSA